jgi:membrane associated rhomboid family serine protease
LLSITIDRVNDAALNAIRSFSRTAGSTYRSRIGFVLLIWAEYTVAIGFLSPAIDNFAHTGGFVGGALIAAFFRPRRRPDLFNNDND